VPGSVGGSVAPFVGVGVGVPLRVGVGVGGIVDVGVGVGMMTGGLIPLPATANVAMKRSMASTLFSNCSVLIVLNINC
jgi:hypothetical protein